ncbi:MAG: 4-(cytidine 5'-diphospho)-2-C-methyl-D-erythritol kinase [Acidobacteriota bacterium]|nr:4-(cytidine 5'-diphospho)-2-C-methyl-D-erythritol kinase [Acidobacteriota bacterium]
MKVTVPSLAKLNLDLRVLHKRLDGFHELRTIFQTITLADRLEIELNSEKRSQIEVTSSIEIVDNLAVRAAKLVLDHLKIKARVRLALLKRIPMGAGLGGGSSNAAAVLIALPALAGRRMPLGELVRLAETLGSDVPFFLHGGTTLAVGRGAELYPLPDLPAHAALVVADGTHVSTPDAYRSLARNVTSALTSQADSPILREFQTVAWTLGEHSLDRLPLKNDFEQAVFRQHPELGKAARKLRRLGASLARMTGSGSAVFGLFATSSEASAAAGQFPAGTAFPVRFVPRRQYRSIWRRALGSAADASCFGQNDN